MHKKLKTTRYFSGPHRSEDGTFVIIPTIIYTDMRKKYDMEGFTAKWYHINFRWLFFEMSFVSITPTVQVPEEMNQDIPEITPGANETGEGETYNTEGTSRKNNVEQEYGPDYVDFSIKNEYNLRDDGKPEDIFIFDNKTDPITWMEYESWDKPYDHK